MYFADPSSFWYAPLSDTAALHQDSIVNVPKLARQFRYSCAGYGLTPTVPQGAYSPQYQVKWNQTSYSTAFWVVDSTQIPAQKVQWLLSGMNNAPASDVAGNGLQALLDTVPLPPDPNLTLMSSGTDGSAAVYDTATDTLYEFWRLRKDYVSNGVTFPWVCSYGGVMLDASRSQGIFPNGWGTSASGSSTTCGLIKLSEINAGVIGHVVRVGVPVTGPGVYAPCTRFDSQTQIPASQPTLTTVAGRTPRGTTRLLLACQPAGFAKNRCWVLNPGAANQETVTIAWFNPVTRCAWLAARTQFAHLAGEPVTIAANTDQVSEGALLRFPADVCIPAGLSPLAAMLMVAIRDHGMIVCDTAAAVGFAIEDVKSLGTPYQSAGLTTNPFDAAAEVAGGYLQMIPWEQLQQVDPAG